MKSILLFILITITSLHAIDIKVAVAANVSYAIDELVKEFNRTNQNTDVKVILGSSGKLTAQIKHGAPYQLFMSANMKYPNALYKENIAVTKPLVYAQGSLAFFSAKKLDFSKSIELLKAKSIKKIAIANPKTAPYGKAAVEAFKSAKIFKTIEKKLIYAESISQSVSYAITAADMGVIAKSALYSEKMSKFKKGANWKELDPKLYTPIKQGIVMLENSKEVKAFYDFILSKKAKEIFQKYGYITE